jgi:hypothetical protein
MEREEDGGREGYLMPMPNGSFFKTKQGSAQQLEKKECTSSLGKIYIIRNVDKKYESANLQIPQQARDNYLPWKEMERGRRKEEV